MTGPEHYREAERLVAAVSTGELTGDALARAQVHAALALAAATAMAAQPQGDGLAPAMPTADAHEWYDVIGCLR